MMQSRSISHSLFLIQEIVIDLEEGASQFHLWYFSFLSFSLPLYPSCLTSRSMGFVCSPQSVRVCLFEEAIRGWNIFNKTWRWHIWCHIMESHFSLPVVMTVAIYVFLWCKTWQGGENNTCFLSTISSAISVILRCGMFWICVCGDLDS